MGDFEFRWRLKRKWLIDFMKSCPKHFNAYKAASVQLGEMDKHESILFRCKTATG